MTNSVEQWRNPRFGAIVDGVFVPLGPDDEAHPEAHRARWIGGSRDFDLATAVAKDLAGLIPYAWAHRENDQHVRLYWSEEAAAVGRSKFGGETVPLYALATRASEAAPANPQCINCGMPGDPKCGCGKWRKATEAAPVAVGDAKPALPQVVLDALRFYANGEHYVIDDDKQSFDTVSGEPQNWLMSERDDDITMFEDGSIARAALTGKEAGFEEPSVPIEGEVFATALASQAAPATTVYDPEFVRNKFADYETQILNLREELTVRWPSQAAPLAPDAVNWRDRCAALIDIHDDAMNNAPEHRCYVDGAWKEELDETRALLTITRDAAKGEPT